MEKTYEFIDRVEATRAWRKERGLGPHDHSRDHEGAPLSFASAYPGVPPAERVLNLRDMMGQATPDVVMTFADSTEGHTGGIYRALNAIYLGKTPRRVTYQGPDGRLHATRQNGRNIPRAEAEANGWEAVWSEPKHRYALVIGKGHPSRRVLRRTVLTNYRREVSP